MIALLLGAAACAAEDPGREAEEVTREAEQAVHGPPDHLALRRATGANGQYAYAPSIVKSGGRYYLFACSTGAPGTHGDTISLVTSDDGVTWNPPTTVLELPSNLAPTLEHACDPSVVLFQPPGESRPYFYLYYSMLEIDNTASAQGTVNAVARTDSPDAPFRHYVGGSPTDPNSWVESKDLNGRRPAFLQKPERPCGTANVLADLASGEPVVQNCYGAGQPSVVARGDTLEMWYRDTTTSPPGIFRTTSSDGVQWSEKERTYDYLPGPGPGFPLQADSVDVKYDEGSGRYVMADVANENRPNALLVVRTSEDGVVWEPYGVDTTVPAFSSNVGISGDERGHMHAGVPLVGFGGPYSLDTANRFLSEAQPDVADVPVECSTHVDCGYRESIDVCVKAPGQDDPNKRICRDVWANWDVYVRELHLARRCKQVSRVAGDTRFDTAAMLAGALYGAESSSEPQTVILVNGTQKHAPHALGAAPLAFQLNAPVLTTPAGALPSMTLAYLQSLGASNAKEAIVVGDSTLISEEVADELALLGFNVRRIPGASHFETAAAIAAEIESHKPSEGEGESENIAFIASGDNPVDALAAGPVASKFMAPIVFVRKDSLPDVTLNVLNQHNLHRLYLLGGENAISGAVANTLEDAGLTVVNRLAGAGRHETAVGVVEFGLVHGMSARSLWIARADDGADAVTVGGVNVNRPLLLSDTSALNVPTADFLAQRKAVVEEVVLLGGYAALSALTEEQTCIALGAIPAEAAPFGTAGGTSTFAKAAPEVDDEGGCAVAPGHSGRPALLAALSALALSVLARRRGLRGARRVSPLRRA